ncbi:unnamed protein product, partial [marine sediment metagenome]
QYNIEIYPKANKLFRLPYGAEQKCIDFEYQHLDSWEEL